MLLVMPTIITLLYYSIERFVMQRRYPYYFYLFIFFLILTLFSMSDISAREYNPEHKASKPLTWDQREIFYKACERHTRDGLRHIESAEKHALFIPNLEHQKLSKDVLRNLLTTIVVTDMKMKAVTISISLLATYLEGVYDNWEVIQYELMESQYNFEMAEFYQDILFFDTINQTIN